MTDHDPATCSWWAEEAPGSFAVLDCPVEGCRFEVAEDDGCGLARLMSTPESIAAWDAGDPVVRGCLAMRRAEEVMEHWECPAGDAPGRSRLVVKEGSDA